MFHALRKGHRWVGVVLAVALLTISVTGFLLAMKATVGWIRPPESKGSDVSDPQTIVSVARVYEAAFAVGLPELRTSKDVDRVDYRPKSNVFKVVSKEGYHEVQVDGATGTVLAVSQRTDQWIEDIHDLSFFNDTLHKVGLPIIAIGLFGLAASGVTMFMVPIVRRRRFKKLNNPDRRDKNTSALDR